MYFLSVVQIGKFCVLSSSSLILISLSSTFHYLSSLKILVFIFYPCNLYCLFFTDTITLQIFYLLMDLKRICNCLLKHFNDGCFEILSKSQQINDLLDIGMWFLITAFWYFGYCVERLGFYFFSSSNTSRSSLSGIALGLCIFNSSPFDIRRGEGETKCLIALPHTSFYLVDE